MICKHEVVFYSKTHVILLHVLDASDTGKRVQQLCSCQPQTYTHIHYAKNSHFCLASTFLVVLMHMSCIILDNGLFFWTNDLYDVARDFYNVLCSSSGVTLLVGRSGVNAYLTLEGTTFTFPSPLLLSSPFPSPPLPSPPYPLPSLPLSP